MFCWSFTSLVHFWPPPIFNSGYAYDLGNLHQFRVQRFSSLQHGMNTESKLENGMKIVLM